MLAGDFDITTLAPFANLGIGGGLAALMFWFYRRDRQDSEARLVKSTTESETRLAERDEACERRYATIAQDYKQTLQETTKALTQLTGVIDRDRR